MSLQDNVSAPEEVEVVASEKPIDNTVTLSLDRAKLEELCRLSMGVTMSAIVRHLIEVALDEVRKQPPLARARFRARLVSGGRRAKPKAPKAAASAPE